MVEIVVVALLAFIAWQDYQRRQERREFFDYIKAKDADELVSIKLAGKRSENASNKLDKPDLAPIEVVSDVVFDNAIKKELGRESFVDKAKETLRKKVSGR